MEQYNKWKKNTLEEINSRVNEAEQINEREDKSRGNHYWEAENRNADSLRNLWTDIKHPKIHIIGVSEWEESERVWENIWRDNSWKRP